MEFVPGRRRARKEKRKYAHEGEARIKVRRGKLKVQKLKT
jgi:hypothetical protein